MNSLFIDNVFVNMCVWNKKTAGWILIKFKVKIMSLKTTADSWFCQFRTLHKMDMSGTRCSTINIPEMQ